MGPVRGLALHRNLAVRIQGEGVEQRDRRNPH